MSSICRVFIAGAVITSEVLLRGSDDNVSEPTEGSRVLSLNFYETVRANKVREHFDSPIS